MSQRIRRLTRTFILASVIVAVPAVLQLPAHADGANLLPNAGFEQSVLEPDPVPQYTQPQPILPNGWIFEGAAGLFDHSPNFSHSGRRGIAISIPAGGKRRVCAAAEIPCVDNPVTPQRPQFEWIASLNPYWRTARPVPVSPGTTYRLSVWTSGQIITAGEGMITKVRWVDANGLPIPFAETPGPSRIAGANEPDTLDWVQVSGTMVAPAGAAGAIVMLGHSDDVWIGQARYDDVYFGAA